MVENASNFDQGFQKKHRLLRRTQFAEVYQQRQSASDKTLVVYVARNNLTHCRLGLSVSRKVGTAVCRNHWKRLIRESFRMRRDKIPSGLDIIVIPRQGSRPRRRQVGDSLVRLIEKLHHRMRARENP